MSTGTPGYVFQCHAPPTPSPSSMITKSLKPASSSLMAAPMPENPAPMTMISWSGAVAVLMRSPRSLGALRQIADPGRRPHAGCRRAALGIVDEVLVLEDLRPDL